MAWVEKMKTRWKVESALQFWLIMLVFSLAGSSIMFVKAPIYELLHIDMEGKPFYLAALTWLAFIVPTYKILLLIWAAILGQWSFFWTKEKKMGRWFLKVLRLKKPHLQA